jgi:hypothetical protein
MINEASGATDERTTYALLPAVLEPEVGFEPTTFRLRVETHVSSRSQPGRFWLLTSAGSSVQCVPDLACYGVGMTKRTTRPLMEPTQPSTRHRWRSLHASRPAGGSALRPRPPRLSGRGLEAIAFLPRPRRQLHSVMGQGVGGGWSCSGRDAPSLEGSASWSRAGGEATGSRSGAVCAGAIRGGGRQGRRTRSPRGRQARPSSDRLGRRRRVEHPGRAGDGPRRLAPCRLG